MSYQVIARKWRPQVFEEVIGQEPITRTLRNAVETDRLHHAYLFSGARGVGKTTTARLVAKSLNCRRTDEPNPVPCDTTSPDACASCAEIAESRSLDVLEFDAASHTKVDEIREIILESININPARDRYKVFIIDEVHMLSKSSFNALLKTLEEPPENVVFVMATTELHKVPVTILSRCQQFEFRTIPLNKILDRLTEIAKAEGIEISDNALREIARSGEGSMRDAQSNFDQVISFSEGKISSEDVSKALGIASTDNLKKVMSSIADRSSAGVLSVVDDLIARGHDLRNFCRDLMAFTRDLLVFKIAGDAHGLLDTAILTAEEMKGHSAPFLEADLIRFFNSLADTEMRLRDAAEPRYVLEVGLVKLIEMRRVLAVEEILERLARLESGSAQRTPAPPEETENEPPKESAAAAPEKKTSDLKQEPDRRERITPEPLETLASPPQTDPVESSTPAAVPVLDPDLMLVRMPPISSEELEHIEDAKLDAAFESALLKEGDDLLPVADAESICGLMGLGPDALRETPGDAGNADAKLSDNARRIIGELTAEDPEDLIVPEHPGPDADDDAIRKYAENHPFVRRVKNLMKASVVEVRRK